MRNKSKFLNNFKCLHLSHFSDIINNTKLSNIGVTYCNFMEFNFLLTHQEEQHNLLSHEKEGTRILKTNAE